jgi:hypothetical protein
MTKKDPTPKAEPVINLWRLAEMINMNRVEKPAPSGLQVFYECRLCKSHSRGLADAIPHVETCPLERLK